MDDLIWTGSLNDPYAIRRQRRALRHDAARRRADRRRRARPGRRSSRSRGCSTSSAIDRIEAGFPRVSDDDWQAVELIAGAGLRAEVWGFSRAVPADLEALVELGVQLLGDRVADLRPEARCDRRLARDDARADRERDALRRRARHPRRVLRRRLDARRAATSSGRVYSDRRRGGREGGRRRRHARDRLARRRSRDLVGHDGRSCVDGLPVHFHGHNDFGVATASAVAAVRAGATWVHGTINGMGERAGNANLGEVALTLRALYGVESNLRLDRIRGGLGARARAVGLRARAVEAASPARRSTGARPARSLRSSTTRRRSSRTRRSWSARSARSCSARRAVSTRSASRPTSSGSTCPRIAAPRCSRP